MRGTPVIILGASKGLGAALTEYYSLQGRPVFTLARSTTIENSDLVIDYVLDVTDENKLLKVAQDFTGQEVLLIFTAATIGSRQPLVSLEKSTWKAVLDLNLLAPISAYVAFSKYILPTSHFVVFSGGGVGGNAHQENAAQYVVSKTALTALVEEISRQNIGRTPYITALAPGAFNTGFQDRPLQSSAEVSLPSSTKDEVQRKVEIHEIQRLVDCLTFIQEVEPEITNGRLISVNWDRPSEIERLVSNSITKDSFGKLRRIDESLFGIKR